MLWSYGSDFFQHVTSRQPVRQTVLRESGQSMRVMYHCSPRGAHHACRLLLPGSLLHQLSGTRLACARLHKTLWRRSGLILPRTCKDFAWTPTIGRKSNSVTPRLVVNAVTTPRARSSEQQRDTAARRERRNDPESRSLSSSVTPRLVVNAVAIPPAVLLSSSVTPRLTVNAVAIPTAVLLSSSVTPRLIVHHDGLAGASLSLAFKYFFHNPCQTQPLCAVLQYFTTS